MSEKEESSTENEKLYSTIKTYQSTSFIFNILDTPGIDFNNFENTIKLGSYKGYMFYVIVIDISR
jgi:hypothetical protein